MVLTFNKLMYGRYDVKVNGQRIGEIIKTAGKDQWSFRTFENGSAVFGESFDTLEACQHSLEKPRPPKKMTAEESLADYKKQHSVVRGT